MEHEMRGTPVTPEMTMAEVLATGPAAARVLVEHRMHCAGCEIARFETLAEACAIYGVDVDVLMAEIHRAIAAKEDGNGDDGSFDL